MNFSKLESYLVRCKVLHVKMQPILWPFCPKWPGLIFGKLLRAREMEMCEIMPARANFNLPIMVPTFDCAHLKSAPSCHRGRQSKNRKLKDWRKARKLTSCFSFYILRSDTSVTSIWKWCKFWKVLQPVCGKQFENIEVSPAAAARSWPTSGQGLCIWCTAQCSAHAITLTLSSVTQI